MQKNGRSLYIDALRGYAILLVVLGHAAQRATLRVDIFRGHPGPIVVPRTYETLALFSFLQWHMPLFMALSGYLAWSRVREPVEQWLSRKALLLLVPFMSWTVVYYWVPDHFMKKQEDIISQLRFSLQHPENTLWYLYVLFIFYVLVALADRSGIGDWYFLIAGVVIMALPPTLFGVGEMQNVYWWFVAGYLSARFVDVWMPYRNWIWIAGCAAYPILVWAFVHYKWGALLGLVRLSGIIASTLLVVGIVAVGGGPLFAHLGRHSLEIYAGHFLFLSLPLLSTWLRIPLVAVVATAGALALGWLLRRWRVTDLLFLGERHRPVIQAVPTGGA